jgi:hypothetical protein
MEASTASDSPKLRVEIFMRKSALFRVIHADGVWCSVNPYRNLHLTFYNERAPIPQSVFITHDDKEGWKELSEARDVKQGWFREMEVDIVLDLYGARGVHKALGTYIAVLEEQERVFDEAKKQKQTNEGL